MTLRFSDFVLLFTEGGSVCCETKNRCATRTGPQMKACRRHFTEEAQKGHKCCQTWNVCQCVSTPNSCSNFLSALCFVRRQWRLVVSAYSVLWFWKYRNSATMAAGAGREIGSEILWSLWRLEVSIDCLGQSMSHKISGFLLAERLWQDFESILVGWLFSDGNSGNCDKLKTLNTETAVWYIHFHILSQSCSSRDKTFFFLFFSSFFFGKKNVDITSLACRFH